MHGIGEKVERTGMRVMVAADCECRGNGATPARSCCAVQEQVVRCSDLDIHMHVWINMRS